MPNGMSGGAIIAIGRANCAGGTTYMQPYVLGLLTRSYPDKRRYVTTAIGHLRTAIGLGPRPMRFIYNIWEAMALGLMSDFTCC